MTDYSTGRNLHVDAVLSNIVIGRRPSGFIADQLVPVLNVGKQSDLYYKTHYLLNRQYVPNLTARAPGTEAKKVGYAVSSDTYFAKNYALGDDLVVEDEVNADEALQWATLKAQNLTDRMLIDYEMRVAELANATTSVHTTINAATPYSNRTGSRPMDELADIIEAFRQATGERPNTMVVPEQIAQKLRTNDQIRDQLFGDRGGVATDAQIASLLKIDRILVPELLVNTFGVGETLLNSVTLSNAWGNFIHFAKISPLPGRQVDTWMQAFRWTNPALGTPWAVKRFPFDPKKKSYGIEVEYYQSEKIISRDLCWRVDSVIV